MDVDVGVNVGVFVGTLVDVLVGVLVGVSVGSGQFFIGNSTVPRVISCPEPTETPIQLLDCHQLRREQLVIYTFVLSLHYKI